MARGDTLDGGVAVLGTWYRYLVRVLAAGTGYGVVVQVQVQVQVRVPVTHQRMVPRLRHHALVGRYSGDERLL